MMTSGSIAGYQPVATSPELTAPTPPGQECPIQRVVDDVEQYFRNHHFNVLEMATNLIHNSSLRDGSAFTAERVIEAAEKLGKYLEEKVEAELKKL